MSANSNTEQFKNTRLISVAYTKSLKGTQVHLEIVAAALWLYYILERLFSSSLTGHVSTLIPVRMLCASILSRSA